MRKFFSWNSILTLVLAAILIKAALAFVDWAFIDAVWRPASKSWSDTYSACSATTSARTSGCPNSTYHGGQRMSPPATSSATTWSAAIAPLAEPASAQSRNCRAFMTGGRGIVLIVHLVCMGLAEPVRRAGPVLRPGIDAEG